MTDSSIGLKIRLEGEREFKRSLTVINHPVSSFFAGGSGDVGFWSVGGVLPDECAGQNGCL